MSDQPQLPKSGSALLRNEALVTSILQLIVLATFIPIGIVSRQYWLAVLSLPVIFCINLGWSIKHKSIAGLITLSLLAGLSQSAFAFFLPDFLVPLKIRVALSLASFSLGWFIIWYFAKIIRGRYWWWAFLPGSIILSGGFCGAFSAMDLLDFVFFLGGGTGMGLLAWGLGERLLGLLIAGSITLTTAPGVSFAFKYFSSPSILSRIGIMAIWMAVGWGLITASSRVSHERYIWWPLIPGGVLAGVGMGLYFGGDPKIAATLLGNTGALGGMIFAGYIVLLRMRFHSS